MQCNIDVAKSTPYTEHDVPVLDQNSGAHESTEQAQWKDDPFDRGEFPDTVVHGQESRV